MSKTIAVAREFMRLYIEAAKVDPDASDPASSRGVMRTIQSRFPGISVAEMKRANAVMLNEMEAFLEEMGKHCKEMGALLDAADAAKLHGRSAGPLMALFERVAAEAESMGDLTPENVFPTKPDASKS